MSTLIMQVTAQAEPNSKASSIPMICFAVLAATEILIFAWLQ